MQPEEKTKIADLDEEAHRYKVARGGKGSVGNFKKKSMFEAEPGEIGEEKEYELRLKMIADVGFIGFPNAGKSTLLAAITRAFPKIAPYPFTTLRPYVGLAKFVDESQVVFADLPGIIKGAHENKGLGHQFLQHAERTKALLYVIDGSIEGVVGKEIRSPITDYQILFNELKLYQDGSLLNKPSLIVVNKMDREHTNFEQKYQELKAIAHAPILPISAKEGDNLEVLLETIKDIVDLEKAKDELLK